MKKAIESFPLSWPEGRERTKPSHRKNSQFSGTFDAIRRELCNELDRMPAKDVIISSNLPIRVDGMPRSGVQRPDDPGIAVYFKFKGHDMCFACDKYFSIWENLRAIHRTIQAIRGIERWGSSDMMERAFQGFRALPERATEAWRDVFEVPPDVKPDRAFIEKAFRSLSHVFHPDKGGTAEEWNQLVLARDNAFRDLGLTR